MKKIKITICILLITIGFVFNGEIFIFYLDNFQESNYQSRYNFSNVPESDEEIVNDFLTASEKHNVDFYMVHEELQSVYDKAITVYGTQNAIKYLKGKGIIEKNYGSLFLGTTSIKYKSFSNISDLSTYTVCYYIGDQTKIEDLNAFKADLINKYAGGFPKLNGSDKDLWLNLLSVWLIIFGLMLILTAYEILFQKKEIAVRIVLGEDPRVIFLKSVAVDTGSLLIMFLVIPALLHGLSNAYFKYQILLLLLVLFIILDILINGLILRVNFKKDIANNNNRKYLLTSNYILKIITATLCIVVLSGNLFIFSEGYNLYMQRDFFKTHNQYSYYQLSYQYDNEFGKTMEDDDEMNNEFIERFKGYALQYVDLSDNFDLAYPVVLINRNAMGELKDKWPSMSQTTASAIDEKIYLLYPSNINKDSDELRFAEEVYGVFSGGTVYTIPETLEYEKGIQIVGIHKQDRYQSHNITNPIIIFDNTLPGGNKSQAMDAIYYSYDIMYHIPDDKLDAFVSEFQLVGKDVVKSNVLDIYEDNWTVLFRSMKLTLVISIILAFLELALIIFIIQLEYKLNAMEMALKKVHGYTLRSRLKRMLTITVVSSIMGIVFSLIFNAEMNMNAGVNMIWIGIGFMVIEILYILIKANSIERRKISSILKGEKI